MKGGIFQQKQSSSDTCINVESDIDTNFKQLSLGENLEDMRNILEK